LPVDHSAGSEERLNKLVRNDGMFKKDQQLVGMVFSKDTEMGSREGEFSKPIRLSHVSVKSRTSFLGSLLYTLLFSYNVSTFKSKLSGSILILGFSSVTASNGAPRVDQYQCSIERLVLG